MVSHLLSGHKTYFEVGFHNPYKSDHCFTVHVQRALTETATQEIQLGARMILCTGPMPLTVPVYATTCFSLSLSLSLFQVSLLLPGSPPPLCIALCLRPKRPLPSAFMAPTPPSPFRLA